MSALPLATRPLAAGAYAPQAPSEDRLERPYSQFAQCQSRLASPAAASPRESLRPNDAVLAMVAHELRGPLAPLRLAAELLRRTCAGQPETLRTLGMIERQITQVRNWPKI